MGKHQNIARVVKRWVETVVVNLNLCPFAKRELLSKRLHFSVSNATTEEQLLMDLQVELETINSNPSIETTLLIHPNVLKDFYVYNQFLDYADALLVEMKLEGVYQIASFHPEYQFADSRPDEVRNYSNRSPYPMLHLLAEESVEKAIASHPNIDQVPQRNQELLQALGRDKLQALLKSCYNDE